MVKCPNCGAEIEFDPSLQEVKCTYCGETFKIDELNDVTLDTIKGAEVSNDSYSGETYKCNQCGATLMTFDNTAVTFCSYCGSQAIIKDRVTNQINPDFVIPFQKTKEECIKIYKDKIGKFLFAPNYLKKDSQVDKFRGIYMPYAIYNLKKDGIINNYGELYRTRIGDYEYYDKYKVTSDVDVSYEGISFDLVSRFYDNYSTSIPFDFNKAEPFNINYLQGYYADTCDVDKKLYNQTAINIVAPDTKRRLKAVPMIKRHGVTDPSINYDCDSKIGMFPMYFLATRDKTNKFVHYAAINGQTGEIACDIPFDFKKYIGVSIIVSIIIFLLINNSLLLKPNVVASFAIVMALINLCFSSNQFKKIEDKANHVLDVGFASKNLNAKLKGSKPKNGFAIALFFTTCFWLFFPVMSVMDNGPFWEPLLALSVIFVPIIIILLVYSIIKHKENKKQFKKNSIEKKNKVPMKWKYFYKEIIGVIIAVAAIVLNPVEDLYYYSAAFVSLILVILSYKDLIAEHNLLSSNELPQLDERGGNK